MFFLRFNKLLCLFLIVVFVRIFVVFWNDVVDKKFFVLSDVLVILSNIGLVVVGCLWCLNVFLFVFVKL